MLKGLSYKEYDEYKKQFWTEISMLSSLKHKNLISFAGFCNEVGVETIIYKHDFKGKLENYLSDMTLLTWVKRLEISMGVAHALTLRAQSGVLQDHILRNNDICGMDNDYVSALACLRDRIPSFDFSGFTNKDTVPSKAQQTLANVLFSEMIKDMEVHFDMTLRQKVVFNCLRALHAQDFLLAISIDGLGQHMSPVEYCTILKYRLMILLFLVDVICLVFHKACLDSFEEHAVHCKEALVNFLTDPSDGRFTLRPADVLVFRWVEGKHACVVLTGVSPLVRLSSRGFTASLEGCLMVELLSRVQRVMHSTVMTPRSTDVVFKRIGFAIQNGLAAQLVARSLQEIGEQVTDFSPVTYVAGEYALNDKIDPTWHQFP
ncbi:putative reverse transcriptase domain-containing protein [Tanacetum coccineum]